MPLLHLAPFFLSAEPCAKPLQVSLMLCSVPSLYKKSNFAYKDLHFSSCVYIFQKDKREPNH